MKLRINIFDIPKLDRLLDENEFLRTVLKEKQGEWLVETNKIDDVKFFLEKARIKYKLYD